METNFEQKNWQRSQRICKRKYRLLFIYLTRFKCVEKEKILNGNFGSEILSYSFSESEKSDTY